MRNPLRQIRQIRTIRISLAGKCQLLFGTAVVMILSAALAVPWHRIEQLTGQLNERAAGALAEHALAEHLGAFGMRPGWHADAVEAGPAPGAPGTASDATTQPVRAPQFAPATLPAPIRTRAASSTSSPADSGPPPGARLVGLSATRDPSDAGRFDQRALLHFAHRPDEMVFTSYYNRADGTSGYRYAKPIYATDECLRCHVVQNVSARQLEGPPVAPAALVERAEPWPTTLPTTGPAAAGRDATAGAGGTRLVPLLVQGPSHRAGIISVDIGSRIDTIELQLNRVFLLGAGLLAGTLAIVIFWLITSRLILQPVRVLQETAQKVSEGDLNIRSDINTGDELQQLSDTFNVMLANLQHNADQLRSVNKGLDVKLGQLAEANMALYESNRLKSEFLANVSHELRTPLNSILGFAELLKDSVDGSPDVKTARYLNNILRSGRNLLDLINDLLDLAKIEAGRMEVRSEPLSLTDLFEAMTTLLKPMTEPKRVRIEPTVAPDVPIVHTDPGKLQQVLYNFLANAIKFSPDGAEVELTAVLDQPGHVRISVTDRGPGIDPEKHSVIFEKFRQIDGSVTRTHGGSGLGLAISKELTALMGGSIGVASQPGQGATFWIILPLRGQAAQLDVRGRMVVA
jgi:two-component system, NarL family, sensor histidine kinase BarA